MIRGVSHALLAKRNGLCASRAGDALSRYITVRLAQLESRVCIRTPLRVKVHRPMPPDAFCQQGMS